MHSPDETVDEEDVAPQQLSLIKMSGLADGRDDMFNPCNKSMCNLTVVAMLLMLEKKVTPDH